MTKIQLLAEIAAFYTDVGTASQIDSLNNTNWYIITVFETGLSAKSKKPTGYRKNLHFYVYKEGTGSEAAYYDREELSNSVNSDITGDSSLYSINKIYSSLIMRSRVQAAVAKAAQDVLNEAYPFSALSSNAATGQKNVIVGSGGSFYVGKQVVISDSLASETNTIASINSNTLTMTTNLAATYTTANSALVTFKDNKERQKWAGNALIAPDNYTLAMTNFVALNPSIQAVGGSCTDNDIQFVINSYVTKHAVALGYNL
jgi:hypothetical protein